ncbi:hypothetical protein SBV1_1230022 [Verrucomicrobia bacterium]|nr:hypothetical protein SBV1_1230022 [Verrucomicrobiota bacterium]
MKLNRPEGTQIALWRQGAPRCFSPQSSLIKPNQACDGVWGRGLEPCPVFFVCPSKSSGLHPAERLIPHSSGARTSFLPALSDVWKNFEEFRGISTCVSNEFRGISKYFDKFRQFEGFPFFPKIHSNPKWACPP